MLVCRSIDLIDFHLTSRGKTSYPMTGILPSIVNFISQAGSDQQQQAFESAFSTTLIDLRERKRERPGYERCTLKKRSLWKAKFENSIPSRPVTSYHIPCLLEDLGNQATRPGNSGTQFNPIARQWTPDTLVCPEQKKGTKEKEQALRRLLPYSIDLLLWLPHGETLFSRHLHNYVYSKFCLFRILS